MLQVDYLMGYLHINALKMLLLVQHKPKSSQFRFCYYRYVKYVHQEHHKNSLPLWKERDEIYGTSS